MSADIEISFSLQLDVRNPVDRIVVKPVWAFGVGETAGWFVPKMDRNDVVFVFNAVRRWRAMAIVVSSSFHTEVHKLFSLLKKSKKLYEIELVAKTKVQSSAEYFERVRAMQNPFLKDEPFVFADLTLNDLTILSIIPSRGYENSYEIVFEYNPELINAVTSG